MKEIRLPVATKENFEGTETRFIVCRLPIEKAVVEEAYVDGEIHRAPKPMTATLGQLIWFRLPDGHKCTKESTCGIIASVLGDNKELIGRSPIGGIITGEFEPGEINIAGGNGAKSEFFPENPDPAAHSTSCLRFKRFDLEAKSGDVNKIFLTELRVGGEGSLCLSPGPIPFWLINRDEAFHSSFPIVPGMSLSVTIENKGEEPCVLAGHIVFEEVALAEYAKTSATSNVAQN